MPQSRGGQELKRKTTKRYIKACSWTLKKFLALILLEFVSDL
jgi:hypothetical protein